MHKHTTTLVQKYYLNFSQPNGTTQQNQTGRQKEISKKQSRKASKELKKGGK